MLRGGIAGSGKGPRGKAEFPGTADGGGGFGSHRAGTPEGVACEASDGNEQRAPRIQTGRTRRVILFKYTAGETMRLLSARLLRGLAG